MPLTTEQIRKRLKAPFPQRLVIAPVLREQQMEQGEASVDLRLGRCFLTTDRCRADVLDPKAAQDVAIGEYLRRLDIPMSGYFLLHPRQFALGVTLEYVRLPGDLTAHVLGRSRWARVGLIIAMASFVHPWYAGCLTLELQNLGDAPIRLYPGLSVAQLTLEECEAVAIEKRQPGQLTCATRPEYTPLIAEAESKLLQRLASAYSVRQKS